MRSVAGTFYQSFSLDFMAKLKGPMFSLDAAGSFGNSIVYSRWKGINYARQLVIPTFSRTDDQAAIRDIVKDASIAWKSGATVGSTPINSAYKLAYNNAASGFAYSGFNLFIKECIQKNEGVSYDGTLEIPATVGDVTP